MARLRAIVTGMVVVTLGAGGCGKAGSDGGGDGTDDGIPADGSASADAGAEGSTTAAEGTGNASAGAEQGDDADDDDDGDDGPGPIVFDVLELPDAPEGGACGSMGGMGDVELSYIWIANSQQGTISKIDTVTMVEEGRYQAKPANGDPSRTSVNLNGDVAVANRNGGVAKFWANTADCVDADGNGSIETSTGPGDVLPWNEDECLAWYTDFICGSNRPVAWTRGEWSAAACSYTDAKVWTVCDTNVMLLDGETGVVEETIPVPTGGFGTFVYGGAADANGNFWGLDTSGQQIFRVDGVDFSTVAFPLPASGGYGITVDPMGRPWVCGGGGASRFNLDTSTWDSTGAGGIGGCMTDGVSTLWHSNSGGTLLGFDIESLDVVEQIQLPEYVHGVSVDFYGNVWGVSFAGSNAYRADPATGQVDVYNGLIGAYTYSDMTGFALSSAGGGGVPTG
jgi:hypothetical protein